MNHGDEFYEYLWMNYIYKPILLYLLYVNYMYMNAILQLITDVIKNLSKIIYFKGQNSNDQIELRAYCLAFQVYWNSMWQEQLSACWFIT